MNRVKFASLVLGELRKADKRYSLGLRKKNTEKEDWWIRCPFHSNGRERTPSLRIQLSPGSRYFTGFKCFGCNARGFYPRLAERLRIDPLSEEGHTTEAEVVPLLDPNQRSEFLGGVQSAETVNGLDWPEYAPWRNISGETVLKAGGKIFLDERFVKERLFLPLTVNGVYHGGIKANIEPEKGGNYFNTVGLKTSSLVMFHDLAMQMLSTMPIRMLAIVEGPRDALNLIQFGLPAVCNLGAVASWSSRKIPLILGMAPDVVILLYDGDDAGTAASEVTKKDLERFVPVYDIELPWHMGEDRLGRAKRVKDIDASDLTEAQVSRIMKKATRFANED